MEKEKLRIAGFKAQKLTLNRTKAPEKLIASNKQHDCSQVLCATQIPTQDGGQSDRGGTGWSPGNVFDLLDQKCHHTMLRRHGHELSGQTPKDISEEAQISATIVS